jgi:mannose/cellobiose epimerase-like protein (N-acyl-D-glucosamine 2-epimerase family)
MLEELKSGVCTQPNAANMTRWCQQIFLPYWADKSHDRVHGGFVDRVDREGREIEVGYKRTRVQARQIFVFSQAAMSGLLPAGLTLATSGVEFLQAHAWDHAEKGWMFKLSPDGARVVDPTREFYCQSFVLFGLSWYLRASGNGDVLPLIDDTLAFLDTHLSEPLYGGYVDSWKPGAARGSIVLPRLQNPHMHLLEALLVAAEATGKQVYLDRAAVLVGLWHDRFTIGESSSITEYFGADWTPLAGAEGRRHEPGHHMEWFWILQNYARLSGDEQVKDRARSMLDATLHCGIDRRPEQLPATFDEVDSDGVVLRDSKRLWPQTETIKGLLAAYEWFGDDVYFKRAQAHLAMMMRSFLHGGEPTYTEHYDCSGRYPLVDFMPVSSVYHLHLCFSEFIRAAGSEAAGAGQ